MKTSVDCMPCLVHQALEGVRFVTDDPGIAEQAVRRTLARVTDMDLDVPPPVMGQAVHGIIREVTGNPDPFQEVKYRYNKLAMGMLDRLLEKEKEVVRGMDPLEQGVRLAIAGNIIDFGVPGGLNESGVENSLVQALTSPLAGNVKGFEEAVARAENILFLADNAGEIVLDCLLIKELPIEKTTVAVRGGPVINDATMEDARQVGLTDLVRVVDNGSDAPATVLSDCSSDFQDLFRKADLVISKGQGNYETLNEMDKNIFFLFKVKCQVVARDMGEPLGSLVCARGHGQSHPV